jgi:hypothetical protein
LIGWIQSYATSYSGSLITIRSCPIASLVGSAGLTEGLDNFSTMASSGVGALEEAIHDRWSASRLSNHGTYQTSNPSKNISIMCTSARYSATFELLQSYSFCTYFVTSYESPLMKSRRMLTSLASPRPVTNPSYSAMLFAVRNSN